MPIYQEIRKEKIKKNGAKWFFRTYYSDLYGNRQQKKSKYYLTKSEAKEAEAEFLLSINQTKKRITVLLFDDLYNEWLNFKKTQVKSSTFYGIKKNTEKHILSKLKNMNIYSITVSTLLQWKKELEKQNITENYKNNMINYFKEILKYAVDNYDFDNKIASKLQKNKIESIKECHKNIEENFWTYEEFNQFISVVKDEEYFSLFYFLYYTGLRISELLALTWDDIDLKNKTVKINKTLASKVFDYNYIITSPKTNNSIRIVDLPNNLTNVLKSHFNIALNMYNYNKSWFVFGYTRPLPLSTIRRKLDMYIKLAKCKKITLHGFRHSHVSLLINIGLDVRQVANRIGDTTEIVESTYYHMFPKRKADAINKLNNFIESEEIKT